MPNAFRHLRYNSQNFLYFSGILSIQMTQASSELTSQIISCMMLAIQ